MSHPNRANESKTIQRAIAVLETTQPTWVLERSGMAKVIADARRRYGLPAGSATLIGSQKTVGSGSRGVEESMSRSVV
jgi:hypothetical protein